MTYLTRILWEDVMTMNNIVVFGAVQSGKSTLIGYLASAHMSDKTFAIEANEIKKRIRKQGVFPKTELILPGFLALDRDEMIDNKDEYSLGTTKRIHRKKVYLEIDSSIFSNHFTFIDTPGNRAKKREQYGCMFEGDIGLCVISAIDIRQYLSLNKQDQIKKRIEARRLFAPLQFWSEFRGTDRLIVVLTKTDFFLNESDELEQIYISLRELVKTYTGQIVPIVPTNIQLTYTGEFPSRIEGNISRKDEKLIWYHGDTLLEELKKKIVIQKPRQKAPFQIAAAKQIRKIPNTSNLALKIQCIYGDLGKDDNLVLGPILNKEREQIFLQATVKSLKIEDGETTNQLSEGVIGGVIFKSLSNYGSRSANVSLADYALSPTTVLISQQFCSGNVICLHVKKDELSECAKTAISQLLPKEQLRFYWFGKAIVADVIEFFEEGQYMYISLANLSDISRGRNKIIALPAVNDNLLTLDLECLVTLRFVEYHLEDTLKRTSQNTHVLFRILGIENINCEKQFTIKLIIHQFYNEQEALNLHFAAIEKIEIYTKSDNLIIIAAKDICMGDLQEYYRYFRQYIADEGIYSYELKLFF